MNQKKKVLIIDDEVDACTLLQRHLSPHYQVHCAHTLTDGLNQIDTYQPDILFLDNNLPDGLGWELSTSIVNQNPHLQVHLISAYGPPSKPGGYPPTIRVWEKPISFRQLDEQLRD